MSGEWSSKTRAPNGKNHKKHFGASRPSGGAKQGGGRGRDYANKAQSENRDPTQLLSAYGICGRDLNLSQSVQEKIFDTINRLQSQSDPSQSGAADDASEDTARERSKAMAKMEQAAKAEAHALKRNLERKEKMGDATKVRVVVCTNSLSAGPRKVLVVPRIKGNLKDFLKTVKNKINAKPHKIKKPERVFVYYDGDESVPPEEIFDTHVLINDEVVVVTDKAGLQVSEESSKRGKKAKKEKKKDKKKDKKKSKKKEKRHSSSDAEPDAPAVSTENVDAHTAGAANVESLREEVDAKLHVDANRSGSSHARRQSVIDPSQNESLAKATAAKQNDQKYLAMCRARALLPAHSKKDEILEAIQNHQVVVISGNTGCGKTTQIPQFILDKAIADGRGGECSIVCTQVWCWNCDCLLTCL